MESIGIIDITGKEKLLPSLQWLGRLHLYLLPPPPLSSPPPCSSSSYPIIDLLPSLFFLSLQLRFSDTATLQSSIPNGFSELSKILSRGQPPPHSILETVTTDVHHAHRETVPSTVIARSLFLRIRSFSVLSGLALAALLPHFSRSSPPSLISHINASAPRAALLVWGILGFIVPCTLGVGAKYRLGWREIVPAGAALVVARLRTAAATLYVASLCPCSWRQALIVISSCVPRFESSTSMCQSYGCGNMWSLITYNHRMLEDPTHRQTVRWSDAGDSFIVVDVWDHLPYSSIESPFDSP